MKSVPERQLEIVYTQLARSSGFRGFSPSFLWSVAAYAAGATILTVSLSNLLDVGRIAVVWIAAAALMVGAVGGAVVVPSLRDGRSVSRETAKLVVNQMLPSIGAGLLVTSVILARHSGATGLLPAVWLLLFGLGVAAVSPVIPARLEIPVVIYFAGAAAAYMFRTSDATLFSLLVGIPFAAGHCATALSLAASRSIEADGEPDG